MSGIFKAMSSEYIVYIQSGTMFKIMIFWYSLVGDYLDVAY